MKSNTMCITLLLLCTSTSYAGSWTSSGNIVGSNNAQSVTNYLNTFSTGRPYGSLGQASGVLNGATYYPIDPLGYKTNGDIDPPKEHIDPPMWPIDPLGYKPKGHIDPPDPIHAMAGTSNSSKGVLGVIVEIIGSVTTTSTACAPTSIPITDANGNTVYLPTGNCK